MKGMTVLEYLAIAQNIGVKLTRAGIAIIYDIILP